MMFGAGVHVRAVPMPCSCEHRTLWIRHTSLLQLSDVVTVFAVGQNEKGKGQGKGRSLSFRLAQMAYCFLEVCVLIPHSCRQNN